MTASMQRPVVVTPRRLLAILRKEAAAFAPDKDAQYLWAHIAARDLVSTGKVRLRTAATSRRPA